MNPKYCITVISLLALAGGLVEAAPVGTAFTYQGRLSQGAGPANGYYDFAFVVFDDPTAGANLGPTNTLAAVPVTNGLFTATLDFGSVFDGNARWLGIWVRTNAASSYAGLLPRQPITPSPYALYAPAAGLASTANNVALGSVTAAGLAAGAVGTPSIATGAVTTVGLADNSVTAAKLASDAASLAKVTGGTMAVVGNNELVQGSIGINGGAGDSALNVQGQVRLNDSNLVLRAGTDLNHGLGYRASVGSVYVDGPFLYGYNGGALGVAGPETVALSWNYLGNVSVSNNLAIGNLVTATSLVVDQNGTNAGSLSPGLTFGISSGEGISSKRTAGGNLFGLDFYTAFVPRLSIDNSGNVFINSAAANGYRLYVNGPAFSTGGWSGSDIHWKKNVQPITHALDKVTRLQGVSYDWRREEFPDRAFDDGPQLGFIAQDVEKVVPEVVRTDTNGYKAIAYEKLTAVLAESIKEQQAEIEALKSRNAALEGRLTELSTLVKQALVKVP